MSARPTLTLLPDDPSRSKDDAFEHAAYARAVARVVRGADRSLTLGLFGKWGVGKSDVIQRLRSEVEEDAVVIVFDAWRYDEGDSVRRQLLRDVVEGLRRDRQIRWSCLWKGRLDRYEADEANTRMRLDLGLWSLLTAVVTGLVAAGIVYGALQFEDVKDVVGDDTGSGPIAAAAAILTFGTAWAGLLLRPAPRVTTRKRLAEPHEFEALWRKIVAATKTRRLVVAIDNLDRCGAERVVEVLSTIKAYLETPALDGRWFGPKTSVVVVVAVDDAALRRHLEKSGNEAAEQVDEYLAKIFASSIRMAPLLEEDLGSFVSSKAARAALGAKDGGVDRVAILIAHALRGTPRGTIQFLNHLALNLALLRERGHEPDVPAVTKLLLIERRWPAFFALVRERPHLLTEWQEQASSEDVPATVDTDDLRDAWPELAAFLMLSSDAPIENIWALLHGKLSEAQRKLRGFDDFRIAVVRGNIVRAESFVGEGGDPRPWAAQLTEIFDAEVPANPGGALMAVDVAARSSVLRDHADLPALLGRALDHHRVRPLLANIDLAGLGRHVDGLTPGRRHRALNVLLDRFEQGGGETPAALASGVRHLDPEQRKRLVFAISDGPRAQELATVNVLVEADETLLTDAVARATASIVERTPQALLRGDGTVADRTIGIALRRHRNSGVHDSLLRAVVPLVTDRPPQLERFVALFDAADLAAGPQRADALQKMTQAMTDDADAIARWGEWFAEKLDEPWAHALGDPIPRGILQRAFFAAAFRTPAGQAWARRHAASFEPRPRAEMVEKTLMAAIGSEAFRAELLDLAADLEPEHVAGQRGYVAVGLAEGDGSIDEIAGVMDGGAVNPALQQVLLERLGKAQDRGERVGEWFDLLVATGPVQAHQAVVAKAAAEDIARIAEEHWRAPRWPEMLDGLAALRLAAWIAPALDEDLTATLAQPFFRHLPAVVRHEQGARLLTELAGLRGSFTPYERVVARAVAFERWVDGDRARWAPVVEAWLGDATPAEAERFAEVVVAEDGALPAGDRLVALRWARTLGPSETLRGYLAQLTAAGDEVVRELVDV